MGRFLWRVAVVGVKFVLVPVIALFGILVGVDCHDEHTDAAREHYASRVGREDAYQLTRQGFRFAQDGIAILIRSRSPVVLIERAAAVGCPYYSAAFRVVETQNPLYQIALVPYEFHGNSEWAVQVYNADGYWYGESPWFPAEPDMGEKVWRELWAIRRGVRVEAKRYFPDFDPNQEVRRAGW